MDKISLHNKINILQSEMLEFHKKISPVKSQEPEIGLPFHNAESKFISSCIDIAFGFLKICICVLGPAAFPAVIFCIEGSSQLFWQATAISSIITLILALMTLTVLYANVKKFKQRIGDMSASLRYHFSKLEIFRFVKEVTTSDALKKNARSILYLLVLIFACILISLILYAKNLKLVFYGSLVSIGFLSGILSSKICSLFNSPDLPFYSPCSVEMHVTAPSPEVERVKRNLNFTHLKSRELSPEFKFSMPKSVCLSKKGVEFTETRTIAAILPNSRIPAFQGLTGTQTLQLPMDFRNLFRRLSF